MEMTDHLTNAFEINLIGGSRCILVVDQIFVRIAVYKLGLHARLDQILWICQKYTSHLIRWTIDGRWTKHHGLLKEVDIQRDLMV